jgi:hypothetical protein
MHTAAKPPPCTRYVCGSAVALRVPCLCGRIFFNDEPLSWAEILEPPAQGATDATWNQRELPALSVERYSCRGCVLSDGRFAVLGGVNSGSQKLSSR